MTSNKCNCPSPPGGTVTCSPQDYAYCYVLEGRVQTGCYKVNPDVYLKDSAFLAFLETEIPAPYDAELRNNWTTVRIKHTMVSEDGEFRFHFSPPEEDREDEPQVLSLQN